MKVGSPSEKRRGGGRTNYILTLFAGRCGDERPRPSEEENDGGGKASRRPHRAGREARVREEQEDNRRKAILCFGRLGIFFQKRVPAKS
jgi:hypothetical protein